MRSEMIAPSIVMVLVSFWVLVFSNRKAQSIRKRHQKDTPSSSGSGDPVYIPDGDLSAHHTDSCHAHSDGGFSDGGCDGGGE